MALLGAIMIASGISTSFLLELSFSDAMLGIFAPLTPSIKEIFDMWRNNLESARSKEKGESKAAALWDKSMDSQVTPTLQECREIQDRILLSRQSNPIIPDWFYWLFRNRNEGAMQTSVADYVEEARSHGLL